MSDLTLTSLTIDAFRGLKDIHLESPGRVNLLVGANNAGKTSVLEAIDLLASPLDHSHWFRGALRRQGLMSSEKTSDAIRWFFPRQESGANAGEAEPLSIRGMRATGRVAMRATCEEFSRWREESPREPDEGAPVQEMIPETTMETGIKLNVSMETEQAELFPSPTELVFMDRPGVWATRRRSRPQNFRCVSLTPYSHRMERMQIANLSEATTGGMKELVVDAMRLFDPAVESVEIVAPDGVYPLLRILYRGRGSMPVEATGDGMRRVLATALAMPGSRGGVLLVDEIESALHTSVLVPVFRWIAKVCEQFAVQLFATTHSLEAIDAIIEGMRDQLDALCCYHFARRDGRIEARRYRGPHLQRIREERGLDIR